MLTSKHVNSRDHGIAAIQFLVLPDEILQNILFHLPPFDLAAVLQTSSRLNRLAQEPALWRYHCLTYYRYWDKRHHIRQKFADSVSSVDWKELFLYRRSVDIKTSLLLDSILESQTGRIDKFLEIVNQGYDAKDILLRGTKAADEVPDVLARSLDELASLFRLEVPALGELTPRAKATALAGFLRRNNLTGGISESSYRDLRNNFIGFALRDKHHPSLPLVSVAIFCCLAMRIGLTAQPCGFPFHVLAIVGPPPSLTLDNQPTAEENSPEPMYLDPFQSDQEIAVGQLHRQLNDLGVSLPEHAAYLGPSSIAEITLRAERNIMHSVSTESERNAVREADIPFFYLESALYSALWASLILDVPAAGNGPAALNVQRRQYLPYLIHNFETHFSEDVSLVQQHILPMFQGLPQYSELRDAVDVTRAADRMPRVPKSRAGEDSRTRVPYRIGQVLTHKRYGYVAVITGWDAKCEADERWVQAMGVDNLSGGRCQSFYHVLVEDKSVRYVAEENIGVMNPHAPSPTMLQLAGKHFKRWDPVSSRFVSNIRDEYPDD
ncbi:MAG: hypothetical protein M1817_004215 [Caeruleum heppii]|nr:MAG: hypothetical protein M1817_004215 [Caeruleum heppii]